MNLKIYSTYNNLTDCKFNNIVIQSYDGLNCNLLKNIKTFITKDYENALVIYLANQNKKNKHLLNDDNELIDLYRIGGTKHLMIIKTALHNIAENIQLSLFFSKLLKNSEKILLDKSIFTILNRTEKIKNYTLLSDMPYKMDVIKTQINNGEVKEAADNLGYLYQLRGKIVYGDRVGRNLGYPTANLLPDENRKIIPANGVYSAFINFENKWYKSMVNIGIRPTLKSEAFTIEAHLLNFQGTLYEKSIAINFAERLRDEMQFTSLENLKKQLLKDEQKTINILDVEQKNISFIENFCFLIR